MSAAAFSVQRTTLENYYLWLHSGGRACVPAVGVCCIMWRRVKQEGGKEGEKEFFSMGLRVNVHSWIPPLKYVDTEWSSRRMVEGKPEVKMRPRKATPERRRLTVSSSSLNHRHPSPTTPPLAERFSIAPHPENSSVIYCKSLSCRTKLPSHLLNGAWAHSGELVSHSAGNRATYFKPLKLVVFVLKLEWSRNNEP